MSKADSIENNASRIEEGGQMQMTRSNVAVVKLSVVSLEKQVEKIAQALIKDLINPINVGAKAFAQAWEKRNQLNTLNEKISSLNADIKNVLPIVGNARLSELEKNEIRSLYNSRLYTQQDLAASYGVSQPTIADVVKNKSNDTPYLAKITHIAQEIEYAIVNEDVPGYLKRISTVLENVQPIIIRYEEVEHDAFRLDQNDIDAVFDTVISFDILRAYFLKRYAPDSNTKEFYEYMKIIDKFRRRSGTTFTGSSILNNNKIKGYKEMHEVLEKITNKIFTSQIPQF